MKPGGTQGGDVLFYFGLGLFLLGFGSYLFFDSVRVVASNSGFLSGMMGRGGLGSTVSNGLIFTPFFLGIVILFYDSKKKWAWIITGLGIALVVVEILSRTRFHMNIKVSHLMILLLMMASGTGLLLRSFTLTKPDNND